MQKTIGQSWQLLADRFCLSSEQLSAYKRYAVLLQDWNKKINLTAIDDPEHIIVLHFQDSLEITRHIDFNKIHMIADVGTGAGFPGLPLKIMYPHLELLLIEVNHKKLQFLHAVIEELCLQHIQLIDIDWRTFIRKTNFPIELFLARASLQPTELIRIYKVQSPYQHAQLIYWASQHWVPDKDLALYVDTLVGYQLDGKQRQYVFFKNPQS